MPVKKPTSKKAAAEASKKSYLAERATKIREMYLRDGLESRDIAAALVADGTIKTTDRSLQSAIRLVQVEVAKIRAEIDGFRADDADGKVATSEVDALERKLARLRLERDRQQLIAEGQPMEMCAVSRWPIGACANPACLATGQHVPFVGPAPAMSQKGPESQKNWAVTLYREVTKPLKRGWLSHRLATI
jgi:hypothetical protein